MFSLKVITLKLSNMKNLILIIILFITFPICWAYMPINLHILSGWVLGVITYSYLDVNQYIDLSY